MAEVNEHQREDADDFKTLMQQQMGAMLQMMHTLEQNRVQTEKLFCTALQQNQQTTEPSTASGKLHYQIMPDLDKSISNFSGDSGSMAMEWLDHVNSCTLLHRWPEQVKLEMARIHLISAAKNWYDVRKNRIKSWDDFEIEFKATFDLKPSLTSLWIRMTKRVQYEREQVEYYFHEKFKLCSALELPFEEIKEQIVIGLNNKQIVSSLLIKEHFNENDLLHDIVQLYRIAGTRERDNRMYLVPRVENVLTFQKNKPIKFIKEEGSQVKCYNCAEKGHISKECPKTSLLNACFKCKENGHFSKNCTKRVLNTNDLEKAKSISLVNTEKEETVNSVNKFLRVVIVNGHQLDSMIDMGSAICTIKENVIKYFPTVHKTKEDLYAFGTQQPVLKVTTYVKADLEIDNVKVENIKFYVVPEQAQMTDVLVGRSYTEHPSVAYIRSSDKLIFGYNHEEPFKNMQIEEISCRTKIKSAENSVILAKQINYVKAHYNDEVICVPVVNNSDENVHIREGEIIGTGYTHSKEIVDAEYDDKIQIVEEMLNVDPNTDQLVKDELLKLCTQYRDCFAFNLKELGCTDVVTMDINDTNVPIRKKPYRANLQDRQIIKNIVQDWKNAGIVTETMSPYASPVVLIRKKTGEPRLVIDYRALNAQTIKTNFPILSVDDHLENLSGSKLYSKLDLAHGYLQVPLSEAAKAKTAFITPDTTGQFERLIFGLTNGPYEFSRLMSIVLGPLKNKIAMSYLDDLIVPAKDWTEMLQKLAKIFEAFRQAKLTLKLRKCEFGLRRLEFLGFMISGDGISPSDEKTNAVKHFRRPQNVHDVRRFLGLTSYFRRFIHQYATRARNLSNLTRKNRVFTWSKEQESAFQDLRDALMSDPVLKLYNPCAKETALFTDASAEGISGILMQLQEDGILHPIYYISKKTSDVERNYHSSKLELMAIVYCVEKLRIFLIGIEFTVFTDCQALLFLNTQKTQSPQIARWYGLLADYNMTIKYRPGIKMSHADALSRAPMDSSEADMSINDITERINVLQLMSEEDYVLTIQRSDEKLCKLIQVLNKDPNERSRDEKESVNNYVLQNGKLFREIVQNGKTRLLYVIPNSMRKAIVVKHHDLMGHFAVDRTVAKIQELYWFARLKSYVRRHISACPECILVKIPAGKQPGFLNPLPVPNRPFARIHIDHLGPFIRSVQGHAYILVVIDSLTKYVKLYPTASTDGKTVVSCLENFMVQYGIPDRIVSDRATCFTSDLFKKFIEKHGIRHTLNSTQWARANGQGERVNRTLLPVIITSMRDETCWDEDILNIEKNLNIAVNKSTGKPPFEVLYSFMPRFSDDKLSKVVQVDNDPEWTPSLTIQNEIHEILRENQQVSKQRHDLRRWAGISYNVGDIVFMRKIPISTGESTKTQKRYRGPYIITEVLPANTYRIASIEGIQGRRYTTTAHVSQLKIYKNPEDDVTDEEDENLPETETSDYEEPEEINTTDAKKAQIVDSENIASAEGNNASGAKSKRTIKKPAYLQEYDLF